MAGNGFPLVTLSLQRFFATSPTLFVVSFDLLEVSLLFFSILGMTVSEYVERRNCLWVLTSSKTLIFLGFYSFKYICKFSS